MLKLVLPAPASRRISVFCFRWAVRSARGGVGLGGQSAARGAAGPPTFGRRPAVRRLLLRPHRCPFLVTLVTACCGNAQLSCHDTRGRFARLHPFVRAVNSPSYMPVFPPLPLGQRIPASPHAVSCSLPTIGDVRGYEEKKPE